MADFTNIDESLPRGSQRVNILDDMERETRRWAKNTFSLISGFPDTRALYLATWDKDTQPVLATDGLFGYNSSTKRFERYSVSKWEEMVISVNSADSATKAEQDINGDKIVDTYLKIKDSKPLGIPIGDVVYRPYLRSGYVKANGATVQRADYPDLLSFVNQENLWGDKPWQYGVGDGNKTMVLPNYLTRFIEGGENPEVKEAGLPNITGNFRVWKFDPFASGAFRGVYLGDWSNSSNGGGDPMYRVNMDASKSNRVYGLSTTVQPKSIVLIPQIKY